MTVSRSHRNPPNARLITSLAGVNFGFSAHPTTAGARPGGTLRNTESLAKPSLEAERIGVFYWKAPYVILAKNRRKPGWTSMDDYGRISELSL